MRIKKMLGALMITLMSVTFLAACTETPMSDSPADTPVETDVNEGMIELNSEQLAEFNGKDGNKAYIAVDGKIYDVTDVEPWAGGVHAGGQFEAGSDYSDEIVSASPHGLTPLEDLDPIGNLVD